ncbi:DNA-directed DNA polymerase [Senna tora]|uniref:DNA-directed DNA polymerase n=1 Tax=Senna tora TaxID=362788 RepID=A0A834XF37_9FABA|nr:DNA-directed DNA polymerase [Senna tora]
MERTFEPGQRVLLYNSQLKLFLGKLKSRWSRPFAISKVTLYGAIEVKDEKTNNTFLTNGQRLKHYSGGVTERANSMIGIQEQNEHECTQTNGEIQDREWAREPTWAESGRSRAQCGTMASKLSTWVESGCSRTQCGAMEPKQANGGRESALSCPFWRHGTNTGQWWPRVGVTGRPKTGNN